MHKDLTCNGEYEWRNGEMERDRSEKGYNKDMHGHQARKKTNECESREDTDTL